MITTNQRSSILARKQVNGHSLVCRVRQIGADRRVHFEGSPTGEHSIDARSSDDARITAHWEGYVENARKESPKPLEFAGTAADLIAGMFDWIEFTRGEGYDVAVAAGDADAVASVHKAGRNLSILILCEQGEDNATVVPENITAAIDEMLEG